MQIAPLVVVVALGVGVNEVIRTEFVEHGGIARNHGPVAPILQSFDFVGCSLVFWHLVEPEVLASFCRETQNSAENSGVSTGVRMLCFA